MNDILMSSCLVKIGCKYNETQRHGRPAAGGGGGQREYGDERSAPDFLFTGKSCIFAEDKRHSAIWKQASIALICSIFAVDKRVR